MSRAFELAFDSALRALESGHSIEEAVADYPDLEADLRPMLEAAQAAIIAADRTVPMEAMARSRTRVLRRAQILRDAPRPRSRFHRWLPRLGGALAALLVILVSGSGLLLASAQALPGDSLYGVKRAAEDFRLNLASAPRVRLPLALQYEDRRIEEVASLLRLGRHTQVEFEGFLTEQAGARWDVGGVPVLITSSTAMESTFRIGDILSVKGETQAGGWLRADLITPAGFAMVGMVEQLSPAAFIIDGQSFTILSTTEIKGQPAIGDSVRVLARVERGYAVALIIEQANLTVATQMPSSTSSPDGPLATATAIGSEAEDSAPIDDAALIRFTGVVRSISSSRWLVGEHWVTLTQDTDLRDKIEEGDTVEVRGLGLASGDVVAYRIELDRSDNNGEDQEQEDSDVSEEEQEQEDD